MIHHILSFLQSLKWDLWIILGLFGQLFFTLRFVIQWVSSEKKKESYIPIAFWHFSLLGGVTLLIYVIHRRDPVLILGQATGIIIYVRNLMLLYKAKKRYQFKPTSD